MFSQILYTIKNSLRTRPHLYFLIMLTQIVSLLCVFFCYGLIYNAFTEYEEADTESRLIYAEFIAGRYDDNLSDEEKYGDGMSFSYFAKGLDEVLEQLGDNKTDINVHGRLKIGEKYYYVSTYYYRITGTTHDPYEICGQIDGYETGDYITIDGTEYHIVGTSEVADICFFAVSNTPDSVVPVDLLIEMEHQPTRLECKRATDKINELFSPAELHEPKIMTLLEIQMNNTQKALSAILMVIAALNCSLCYNYINRSRRNQFAIYKLCGAQTHHCFAVSMAEVLLYMLVSFGAAYLLFERWLKDVLISFYPSVEDAYLSDVYTKILRGFVIITLTVMSVFNAKFAENPIVEERKEL